MGAIFNRGGQVEVAKGVSLGERFRAWWDGYEILEPSKEAVPAPESEPEPKQEVHYEAPKQRWETSRVSLVQDVWGEGFASPGGHDHILTMVKIFGLDPAMTVLDLGAGLGAAARIMCKKFGVWVAGFEADEALAEAAMALSVKAGMGEKAPIKAFDPGKFQHKPKSVDCVFSKEFLFTVADKTKFLTAIETLLKPKGQFLFTDFVLAKPSLRSPTLETWIEHEPLKPHPWTLDDYQDALATVHLDIRVAEDVTKMFRAMVIKGWADYTQSTRRGSIGEEAAPALVDEVELWSRRIQAIDSGDLKVCRVHAFKKEMGGMISDW